MGDLGTTLCWENLPPIRHVGHTLSNKAELLLIGQGATLESELLPRGAYRSKTEEIKCLTLICRVWSLKAKRNFKL